MAEYFMPFHSEFSWKKKKSSNPTKFKISGEKKKKKPEQMDITIMSQD